jgi:hypothetical protein
VNCVVPGCPNVAHRRKLCGRHEGDVAAGRAVFTCSECGAPLIEPAELCGFCEHEQAEGMAA